MSEQNPADLGPDKPSRVILPGQDRGPMPVDPNDPSKGVIRQVYNNEQITAAVIELASRTERLATGVVGLYEQYQAMGIEIGDLLEQIGTLLLPFVQDSGLILSDTEDEAVESLKAFIAARQEMRDEIAAVQAAREAVENGETPDLFVAPEPAIKDEFPLDGDDLLEDGAVEKDQ